MRVSYSVGILEDMRAQATAALEADVIDLDEVEKLETNVGALEEAIARIPDLPIVSLHHHPSMR
jgi:hypothetical protein